ncbi:SRPBCC family protein [Jongsikchunia kroppenstedtii]|uniref:SRPBCC family protein n=1 Tax=Jongsikchunia kroppenstedtii TaxID=1121721 RepID=UPI00047660FC|nr:SRPBCC family protein [Jongsikchunia kroppenstedtii]
MAVLQSANEAFLANAPVKVTKSVELPVSPDVVWRELTGDNALKWVGLKVVWGPQRTGVGATRQAGPPVGPAATETFFVWEEGKRKAFYIEKLPLPVPGLKVFAEDYVITPTETGARFEWTFALEGSGPMGNPKFAGKVLDGVLATAMKRTSKHFAKLA